MRHSGVRAGSLRRSGSRELFLRAQWWWFGKSAESLRNGHQLLGKGGL